MRLRFCSFVTLGALLLLFSNIQPASASHRFSENFPASQAPRSSVVFEHLTIEDGLSQNAGLALLQDSRGFIWIGTQDGLNQYDGYDFEIFKHDPDDPNSISYNSIIALHEDRNGFLWIGTWGGGLNRYDPKSNLFTSYLPNPENQNSISDVTIPALAEDQDGSLWVGTTGGLDLLVPESGEITNFRDDSDNSVSINKKAIGALLIDREQNLWIGTGAYGIPGTGLYLLDESSHEVQQVALECTSSENISSILQDQNGSLWIGHGGYSLPGGGLTRYDPVSQDCTNYGGDPTETGSFGEANIIKMILDSDGWLWITTYEGGLYRMDVDAPGEFYSFSNVPGDSSSLSSDNTYAIIQDRSGVLWIGTLNSGINKLKPRSLQFGLYRNNPVDITSLSSDKVGSFAEDRNGNIWIGTWGAGLDRFNPYTGRFTHYRHASDDPNSIADDTIMILASDDSGGLWVGTLGEGLDYFDVRKETFIHYRNDPAKPNSLVNDNAISLCLDGKDNLWVGTLDGLDRLDLNTGNFVHYRPDPENADALSHPAVVSLFKDKDDVLWLGTWGGGLNRLDLKDPASFDPDKARFVRYQSNPADPDSLSDDSIWVIHQSVKDSVFWLGTQGGLSRLDLAAGKFKTYSEKDGLRNATILGILEDVDGNLWITTNNGLAKFDPLAETFNIFDSSDGLQSNEFDSNAYFESSNGMFFFGGIHGFNMFNPLEIQPNLTPPEIVVTDFKVFNESIQTDLSGANPITLKHSQDFISFEFAALDYHASQKNQYAYMLEGFDQDWVDSGTRRYASYTNLPGGKYVFHVKGSNGDSVWNDAGVSIPITVTPPFWQTWWFIGSVILVIASTITLGFQWRVRAVKENARKLETLVGQRTLELRDTNNQLEVEIEQRKQAEEALAKRAEDELKQSEARFQAVFENAAVGIAVMGLDRQPIAINPVTEKIIGYSLDELKGVNPRDLAIPEDRSLDNEAFPELIAGKRNSFVMERRYRRKNGEIFWARINYSLVRDLNSEPDYLVGMIEDIDDQKRASERLTAQEAEHRRILEKRIAERTEELNKANELLQQKAAQEAVTAERTRLARDLHDAVTQTLFSATLIADVLPDIWQANESEGKRRLEELRQLTRGALAEMRTLLVELRPNALVEVPLPTLLRQLSEALTGRARIDIQFSFEGERALPPDVQVAFYRIAQEALNNVVKHSKASQAAVMLRLGEQVRLSITDNGTGFDPSTITADHLGLKIMCERSDAIGAKFNLYSEPGEGAQVTVTWQDKETV